MAGPSPQTRSHKGIKEIAKALGVSIGTVDRALHARPGINPMTRQRVLKMAETMGYRPNLAARLLKSQKRFVFSVNLPAEIASFFDAVRDGVRKAAASLERTVQIEFRTYRRLGDQDTTQFEDALEAGVHGIIIAPGRPAEIKSLIRKAAQQSIPVVCVATDAPGTERLASVSADPYTSGAVAAELLCRFGRQHSSAAIVTGFLETMDHAEKRRGFEEQLARLAPATKLADVIEAHDDEREALERTRELLRRNPGLSAIYVSTANSLPVLRALEEGGLFGKITLITTDLFPEMIPLIRSGVISATVYQRPLSQGRIAFEVLHGFVVEGRCPPASTKLVPHVVMSGNLDLILDTLRE